MREITATVLENKRIADEIYSLTFAAEEEIAVRPGQFVMVGVVGFPLRRPIAVCKAEGERITVCYRLKGGGTRALAREYKTGEKLSVLLPLGNGFYVKESEKKVAVVGGGVGIFPLISAIRAYSKSKQVYAYMGFRSRASVCMEFDMTRGEKLVIATDDGSVGFHGTSVQAFMQDVDEIKPDVVLACGPTPMLRALKSAMHGRNIPVYVSLEERMGCGIGACLVCVCEKTDGAHARVCKDGPVFEINDVIL
mgnify:CR=1 FL=1